MAPNPRPVMSEDEAIRFENLAVVEELHRLQPANEVMENIWDADGPNLPWLMIEGVFRVPGVTMEMVDPETEEVVFVEVDDPDFKPGFPPKIGDIFEIV